MILTKELGRQSRDWPWQWKPELSPGESKKKLWWWAMGKDHALQGKQGSPLTGRKRAPHTSCFGSRLANHPCFGTWAVTPPKPAGEPTTKHEGQKRRLKDAQLFLFRSASCSRVFNLDPTDRAKDLRLGGKSHHTILHGMNTNRYSEFQKLKMWGVKYSELGLPSLSLAYMPGLFVSSFHTTAQPSAPDQSVIPIHSSCCSTHRHSFLKPHNQNV